MKFNPKANQVRNLNLSEDKKEDSEMKQEMLDVLKKKTGYKKDIEAKESKRTRRAKIRELAGDDSNKMNSLKETLYTEEEKKELNSSPFPKFPHYASFWDKLTPEDQKQMKENFRETADGKIECVQMKKKFSVLTATHNGKDVFDGSHIDQYGKQGVKGVSYFTGKAAEKEAKDQGKKFLKNKAEVEKFINLFPGESTKDKIFNFVQLFGLEKAGCWHPDNKKWYYVGSIGYAVLSEVGRNGNVYEARWSDDNAKSGAEREASIGWSNQRYPEPAVACELASR